MDWPCVYYYAVVDVITLEEGGFIMEIVSPGAVCVDGPLKFTAEKHMHRGDDYPVIDRKCTLVRASL